MGDKTYTLMVDSEKLSKLLKDKKDKLPDLIKEFTEKYLKSKIDKNGNKIDDTNPYLVSTFFFKPINPMSNVEPIYTSEQLNAVYDLYCYIVEQVNMEVTIFNPSVSHFVKFAGISLVGFNNLRNSVDESMKFLTERINADIFDANMTLAQHSKVTERPTTYRMKVENEMIEKKAPSVNVKLTAKSLDLDKINERLHEIQSITAKKINYEGK